MTVIYNMSIDRADKPWIGDRRLTEQGGPGQSQEICPNRANYCTFAPFATLLKAVLKRSKLP